jgi:HD-like signal output (HDOD) protein
MKKQLLFVDDESKILDGLRRMLRPMRDEWDMSFAESGKEALELMEKEHFDVIVSDMRMPGMDGAELLEKVRKGHPDVVRIVLSGHSEMEAVVKTLGSVHQYLSKPCEASKLKEVISRALLLRNILANDQLMKTITRMTSMPSLPQLYVNLNKELKCTEVNMNRVSKIIENDVGMTAKILQLVNSSFFGFPTRITNPGQAVKLLGIDTIKTMVLSVHIFTEFDKESGDFQFQPVWQHSMDVAAMARKIAEVEKASTQIIESAFIAGMLHDCGKMILAANLPKQYNKILKVKDSRKVPIHEAEKSVLGSTHADVGAYLLGLWGMSDSVLESVAYHHNPSDAPTLSFQPLTCVHAANYFSNEMTNKKKGVSNLINLDMNYLESLELSDRLEDWRNFCMETISEGVKV